jgi:hypothetical protein
MAEASSVRNGAQVGENCATLVRAITSQLLYQLSYAGNCYVNRVSLTAFSWKAMQPTRGPRTASFSMNKTHSLSSRLVSPVG